MLALPAGFAVAALTACSFGTPTVTFDTVDGTDLTLDVQVADTVN